MKSYTKNGFQLKVHGIFTPSTTRVKIDAQYEG